MSAIPFAALKKDGLKNPTFKHNPFGIKMQSKTVVMKKDYVTTGVLTYVEGDIIEVEIADLKSFVLGDEVKVTIYSTGGIHVFETHVVAKDRGSLILLNPPENQSKFAERRENPRVQIQEDGKLLAIAEAESKECRKLDDPMALTIHNISISGIGFTLFGHFDLPNSTELELEVNLGQPMQIKAEVVRRERTEYGLYYGVQFVDLTYDKLTSLRAFLLKAQVESYYRKKEADKHNEAQK